MRPELELLAHDPAGPPAAVPGFLGRGWALGLGTALLAGLALITLARWQQGSPAGQEPETVIQQPVPSEPFPSATRSDTTAPDPGDNPP